MNSVIKQTLNTIGPDEQNIPKISQYFYWYENKRFE